MSSPCPAMPTTSVPKMSGTMIDLIMRRNTVEIGRIDTAKPGARIPSATPVTMATTIHCVSVRRRRKVHMGGVNDNRPKTEPASGGGASPLDERAAPQLVVGALQLLLRVHHDRPLPRYWFLQRLSRHQQEPHALFACVDGD